MPVWNVQYPPPAPDQFPEGSYPPSHLQNLHPKFRQIPAHSLLPLQASLPFRPEEQSKYYKSGCTPVLPPGSPPASGPSPCLLAAAGPCNPLKVHKVHPHNTRGVYPFPASSLQKAGCFPTLLSCIRCSRPALPAPSAPEDTSIPSPTCYVRGCLPPTHNFPTCRSHHIQVPPCLCAKNGIYFHKRNPFLPPEVLRG